MEHINQSKKKLIELLIDVEGFLGAGLTIHDGKECLVVYVTETRRSSSCEDQG